MFDYSLLQFISVCNCIKLNVIGLVLPVQFILGHFSKIKGKRIHIDRYTANFLRNAFCRMKVRDTILIITFITNSDSFLVPKITLTIKPKFNQIKS